MKPIVLALLLCSLLCACSSTETTTSALTEADAAANGPIDFQGGDFQLYVQAVEDGCLDGGLQLLFMPDGADHDYALKNKTFLPGFAELPKTYVMKLAAPFTDMGITMSSAGTNAMKVSDGLQKGVLLGVPGSDDCRADMDIGANVTVEGPNAVRLSATVTLDHFQSPSDTCPKMDAVPCTVALTMRGER